MSAVSHAHGRIGTRSVTVIGRFPIPLPHNEKKRRSISKNHHLSSKKSVPTSVEVTKHITPKSQFCSAGGPKKQKY